MPTTPEQVVAALRVALGIKATVALETVKDRPHAVVAGPSGVQTWVDLRTSMSAYPDEDAAYVAAAIMAFEGWDALHLDDLLSELCIKLGFCDAGSDVEALRRDAPFRVEAFADAVIQAEGLDPMTSEWRGPIRDIVARYFGSGPN